jgi:hypothetical protein
VKKHTIVSLTAAVTLGLGAWAVVKSAEAGMFDFMNPGDWFGGNRHDRYYDRDYYRYGGPYGYGGPWGGYGGPYGYGGGPWGRGYGPYGWGGGYPGYGGYGPGSTIVVTPQSSGSSEKQAPPPPKLPE